MCSPEPPTSSGRRPRRPISSIVPPARRWWPAARGSPALRGGGGGGARGGGAVRRVGEQDELRGRRTAVHFIEGAIRGARDLDGRGRVLGGEQGLNGGPPAPARLLHLFVFA